MEYLCEEDRQDGVEHFRGDISEETCERQENCVPRNAIRVSRSHCIHNERTALGVFLASHGLERLTDDWQIAR
jgi:hypothetical protein